MSAGVGGPGVGGPAVRGPGVGSPGIRGPVVGEPRGDVSGNLTQMQKEMMDEIPFGSPPHRGGHSKPAGMFSLFLLSCNCCAYCIHHDSRVNSQKISLILL